MKHDRNVVAGLVFDFMSQGESLRQACIAAGVSTATIMRWVAEDEALREQYMCAREALIDKLADELLEIADTPLEGEETEFSDQGTKVKRGDMLGHRKLQVDTRKWVLSKLAPKKYGDKVENTIVGDVEKPLVINFVEPPERDVD